MDPFYIAIIGGVLAGAFISYIFKIKSTKDATLLTYKFFNMSISDFISNVIIFLLIASVIFLSTVSVFVKDISYPNSKPYLFAIETLLMSFLPAIVLLLMCVFRGYSITTTIIVEFLIFAAHFGVLHILFQFAGCYSILFPPK